MKKQNIPYIILSVFLAVVFWIAVRLEGDATLRFEVPLDLVNVPGDYIVTDYAHQDLTVLLRGSRTALSLIRKKDLRATIDLAKVKPGVARFKMGQNRINIPRGVRIDEVSPWEITLNIEERLEKTVPVKTEENLVGNPAPGYDIAKVTCTPSKVRITGPRSRLENLSAVNIGRLDISGLKAGLEEEVSLSLPQGVASLGAGTIKVKIAVEEKIVEKIFEGIALEVNKGAASYFKIEPDTVKVKVRGRENLVRNIKMDHMRATVDLSKMSVGYYRKIPLPVVLPVLPGADEIEVSYEPREFDLSLYK